MTNVQIGSPSGLALLQRCKEWVKNNQTSEYGALLAKLQQQDFLDGRPYRAICNNPDMKIKQFLRLDPNQEFEFPTVNGHQHHVKLRDGLCSEGLALLERCKEWVKNNTISMQGALLAKLQQQDFLNGRPYQAICGVPDMKIKQFLQLDPEQAFEFPVVNSRNHHVRLRDPATSAKEISQSDIVHMFNQLKQQSYRIHALEQTILDQHDEITELRQSHAIQSEEIADLKLAVMNSSRQDGMEEKFNQILALLQSNKGNNVNIHLQHKVKNNVVAGAMGDDELDEDSD